VILTSHLGKFFRKFPLCISILRLDSVAYRARYWPSVDTQHGESN
jgi:hypothetical protein